MDLPVTSSRTSTYPKRFDRVLAYIEANLEGDLSVTALSEVAAFSAFHFHRQFTAYLGMPVARYVQLLRLRRAGLSLLAARRRSVLEVALEAGFESPEAFTRAFRRLFGQAPRRFRQAPDWRPWHRVFDIPRLSRNLVMHIRLVEFTAVRIAAFEHRGPRQNVEESVRIFIDWRKRSGQSPVATSRSFGIPFGNPDTTPAEDFRFAIGGEISEDVRPNPQGVRELLIAGGRYAVVRHQGSTDRIDESIYPLYRDWLPESGEELRDAPLFFHYLSVYPETPQERWQTDIYVPLV